MTPVLAKFAAVESRLEAIVSDQLRYADRISL
jgi:hypothetical protein